MTNARAAKHSQVIVIDTTHTRTTADGGCWWEVAIPEVSERAQVNEAHQRYQAGRQDQRS
jgi:3D-(3,5/4)-trihydroxycyclohexane-1,2-dione acylhydrolase (decyclizing)